MSLILKGAAAALAIMVTVEGAKLFKAEGADEVPEVAHSIQPSGWDPTRPPPELAADCRAQGMQFVASNEDARGWIYECVIAVLKSPKGEKRVRKEKREAAPNR